MKFSCYGHENVRGTHKNTFEFTKDSDLTVRGDCIVGVKADFKVADLMDFLKGRKEITIRITVDEIVEEVKCEYSSTFYHDHEIVVRKGDYCSARTLGVKADKASKDFSRELMDKMKDPKMKMEVEIE